MREFFRVWLFSRDAKREWIRLAITSVVLPCYVLAPGDPGISWTLLRGLLLLLTLLFGWRPFVHFVLFPLSLPVDKINRLFERESSDGCPICGYNVSHTLHRCPECGTELQWGELPTEPD